MLFYAFHEIVLIVIAAIVIDMIVGDPPWPTHPVINMVRWIGWLQNKWLYRRGSARQMNVRGAALVCFTLIPAIVLCLICLLFCVLGPLAMSHMQDVVRMLYGVSYIVMGVLMISWVVFR